MSLSNWTEATTTTTGAGTLTLAAVPPYPLPSASLAVNEYVQYSIATSDNKFESGIGQIGAANTLARTRVLSTYDGTTYNNLTATALTLIAGSHTVYLTPMSEGLFEPLRFPVTDAAVTNPVVMSTAMGATQSNVSTAAIQRITCFPFRLETSGLLTGMSVNVSVAGATSTTLLGLYGVASNGSPGRLIAQTSATIDSSTTGYKTQAVSANVRLTPGWYWAAVLVTAGSNPSFTGYNPLINAFGGAGVTGNIDNMRCDLSATTFADPFPTTNHVYIVGSASNIIGVGLILS